MLRKAIPMPTLHTTGHAWEVNLKTSVELYTIWEMTGVLEVSSRPSTRTSSTSSPTSWTRSARTTRTGSTSRKTKTTTIEDARMTRRHASQHTTDNQTPQTCRSRHDEARFTGFGVEWRRRQATSCPEDAHRDRLGEQQIDKRSMLTSARTASKTSATHVGAGEGRADRRPPRRRQHEPVIVKTLYGWDKKIPTNSSGTTSPAASAATSRATRLAAVADEQAGGTDYLDETDQTSCTAWNYHGSGIGNVESLAAVFLRNFHQAYVSAKAQGGHEGPLLPAGALRHLVRQLQGDAQVPDALRRTAREVKKILGKLGRLVDGKLLIPEEIVHYSEWVHVMRDRIARAADDRRVSNIRATATRPATSTRWCRGRDLRRHILGRQPRRGHPPASCRALGAQVIDYSTWYDCCGFGFRHIISEREFTRSFAIDRKIRVAVEEANADVMIGHDTGCITTLDKNQWIGKARRQGLCAADHGRLPVRGAGLRRAPLQDRAVALARLALRDLLEKMGIDWEKRRRPSSRPTSRRSRPATSRPLRPARDHLRPRLSRHDQQPE
jgi:heterodisulfide reductase subunit B2